MRVLIEIVHPADVLFFHRPAQVFRERGDEVLFVSRHKDVACELLDAFGIPHVPLSTAGRGMLGLARELVCRDAALLRYVKATRPDVMLGFGGVAVSHVGWVKGIPVAVFYDSDTAVLQNRLTWPFATSITVPDSFGKGPPDRRTHRHPGIKELSYFHPASFTRDRTRALAAGLDPSRPNIFIRLVEWRANHDVGKSGWSHQTAAELVNAFASTHRLHVSAERNCPDVLRPFLWNGPVSDVHHLIAHCDAMVGESATMACEAVVLGTPAIYAGVDFLGYTKDLQARGLLTLLPPERRPELVAATKELLASKAVFDGRRTQWLKEVPDWSEIVVAEATRLAEISLRKRDR